MALFLRVFFFHSPRELTYIILAPLLSPPHNLGCRVTKISIILLRGEIFNKSSTFMFNISPYGSPRFHASLISHESSRVKICLRTLIDASTLPCLHQASSIKHRASRHRFTCIYSSELSPLSRQITSTEFSRWDRQVSGKTIEPRSIFTSSLHRSTSQVHIYQRDRRECILNSRRRALEEPSGETVDASTRVSHRVSRLYTYFWCRSWSVLRSFSSLSLVIRAQRTGK